jgi:hypothetical protein
MYTCLFYIYNFRTISFIILISFTDTAAGRSYWDELEEFRNHSEFSKTVNILPDIVKNSKAAATNKKYDNYFSKFQQWCSIHNVYHLHPSVSTVALFLGGLIQQKVSTSVLEAYFYSINWQHTFSLKINPCSDKVLTLILEGERRMLAQPINKKEPITKDILVQIVQLCTKDVNNLLHLRTCVLCL